jgi:hypothetical protein
MQTTMRHETERGKRFPTRRVMSSGRDEMNLAEFPIATLRSRGDTRGAIVHEGSVVDKHGNRHNQRWVVSGDSVLGLPNEFDERVYVALMAITAQQGFTSRKVTFSVYQVIKLLQQSRGKRSYEFVEQSLDRLKGITIKTKGAFFDNTTRELVHTAMAFNLIDKYWISYREQDERIREEEGVPAYIVWGEDIWKSFQAGYIKDLDLGYFYDLELPTARRLYRFLDKRMHYQSTYEIDVLELASRLGMIRYGYASRAIRKLQPGIDELIETGFLREASFPEYEGYTRARFVRAPHKLPAEADLAEETAEASGSMADRLMALRVGEAKALDLVAEYSEEHINEKIDLLEWKLASPQRGRPITDQAAWLIRAIEQDFKPPATFQTKAQRRREIEESAQIWEAFELQREQERAKQEELHQKELAQLFDLYGTTEREGEVWDQVLQGLKVSTIKSTFHMWFARTQLLSLRDGVAVVGAPNKITAEWLAGRAQDLLREQLEREVGGSFEIRFEVVQPPESELA